MAALALLAAAVVLCCGSTSASTVPFTCSAENPQLVAWVQQKIQQAAQKPLLPQSTTYNDFILELKAVLDASMLPTRAVAHLFGEQSPVHPTCAGHWLEFGVFTGGTANLAAAFKWQKCGAFCPHLFGFDTFTGLPEAWKRLEIDGPQADWPAGTFDLKGQFPPVLANVYLWPGLFNNTLPVYLNISRALGQMGPVSYLHVDCDLYGGARDVLKLLSAADKIHVGTIIVFDDLVNYAAYRIGELKAMWEWLQSTGIKLATLGMYGPLPNATQAVQLNVPDEFHWFHQSVAFVVVEKPQRAPLPWVELSLSIASAAATSEQQIQAAAAGGSAAHAAQSQATAAQEFGTGGLPGHAELRAQDGSPGGLSPQKQSQGMEVFAKKAGSSPDLPSTSSKARLALHVDQAHRHHTH